MFSFDLYVDHLSIIKGIELQFIWEKAVGVWLHSYVECACMPSAYYFGLYACAKLDPAWNASLVNLVIKIDACM